MSALVRLFSGKNSVRAATGMLVVAVGLSNVLGLVRDRLLAVKIPAEELDTYFAAFRLPDLLTNLIVIGAISVAFLPLFTQLRTENEERAWEAASAILNAVLLALIIGSGLLWLYMPELMPLVVPDFGPDRLEQTIRLARWLTLTPILFGVSYLLSGIVNSFQRFFAYSLAPLVYNVSIIGALLISEGFAPEDRVSVVVIGVVVGASLHMLIQLPVAAILGWRWRPAFTIHHPAVKKLGGLMVPRMVGLLAMQFITIVATAIASAWAGAITYYNLANNIQTMPTAVFASSIATALFPSLSLSAAREAKAEFRSYLLQGLRWLFFLLVPATVGLILLRIQIVRLVLGAGFFGWEATQVTADTLGWFALSLVASGMVPLLARAFYARQDMKTPMNIALVSSLVTIGLSYWLVAVLPPTVRLSEAQVLHVGEVAALAIAFSVGMVVNAVMLFFAARATFGIPWREIASSLNKIILATIVMGGAVQLTKTFIGTALELDRFANILVQTVTGVGVGIFVYMVMVWLLRCEEWNEIRKLAAKKIFTKTSTTRA